MKKKFKMPDSFTILFIIIVIVGALTWFVPAGQYTYHCQNNIQPIELSGEQVCPVDAAAATKLSSFGEGQEIDTALYTPASYDYSQIESNQQGVWQILMAPVNGFGDALDIALFVIIIGGFLNVVMKTGALDAGIGSLLKKFEGREHILIPILMVLFGIGGSTYGMAEETIAFYVFLVPIFIRAGYDAVTGVMVILLGAGTGVLASTVNPFAIGVAADASGVSMGDGIVTRFILFIVVEAAAIWFTMRYAKKVKADMSKSVVSDLHENIKSELVKEEVQLTSFTGAHKLILWLFSLSFVIMIASVIPWTDFGVNLFANMNTYIDEKMKIIAGASGAVELGSWWFGELTMFFLVMAIIIGMVAKAKGLITENFSSVFIQGSKDLLSVALIIGLSRGIKVVMASGGMDATLLHAGSDLLQSFSEVSYIIGSYIFFIPMSFLVPSTSGLAGASMPVMGPLGDIVYGSKEGIIYTITSFSAASGLVNLVTPTSGVVMGGLALARVPYERWLKHVAPFLIILFIISIVFLAVGSMLNITI